MVEHLYEFVTGWQDGWMTRNGWGHPRGTGTRRTRPMYWVGYEAGHDRPTTLAVGP